MVQIAADKCKNNYSFTSLVAERVKRVESQSLTHRKVSRDSEHEKSRQVKLFVERNSIRRQRRLF